MQIMQSKKMKDSEDKNLVHPSLTDALEGFKVVKRLG